VANERFPGRGLGAVSSLDDDIQPYVETLVASFQPEAVDVSPAVGLDGQG
jgi:hypothetical protein